MNEQSSSTFPAAPVATSDKALTILCHLSAILGVGLILPFIVWLVKKNEPDRVASHAKEALNFHLSWIIYGLCCIPLIFLFGLGALLGAILAVAAIVLAIIAAVRASDGELYRYPLTIRFFS